MTAYSTSIYSSAQGAASGHGPYQVPTVLYATSPTLPSTLATNDTINIGYLPPGAVVTSAILIANSQLDSNGAPTLTWDLGVTGTAQLWKAAISTVGRTVGVSGDSTIATTGVLYKNPSATAKVAVIATVHAGAATGVAGTISVAIEYFVVDTVGSQA